MIRKMPIFRLDKRQDRNIETTVEVCDAEGNLIEDCLSGGVAGGGSSMSRYHTVVYYHDGKPKWNEVTKSFCFH
jgi:dedicator of cytokinesis protein 1